MLKKSLMALTLAALPVTAAQASIFLALSDDGSGKTAFALSGTYDLTSQLPIGPISTPVSGARYVVVQATNGGEILEWWDFDANVTGSFQGFVISSSPGDFIKPRTSVGQFPATLSQTLTLFLSTLDRVNTGILAGTDNLTGTLNMAGTWSDIDFSVFNIGIWEWGTPNIAKQGIRLSIGPVNPVQPIPLPAGGVLLLSGLGLAALARRKRGQRASV